MSHIQEEVAAASYIKMSTTIFRTVKGCYLAILEAHFRE